MTCKLITMDWWPETFSIQGIVLFYLQDFFPHQRKKKVLFQWTHAKRAFSQEKLSVTTTNNHPWPRLARISRVVERWGQKPRRRWEQLLVHENIASFFFLKQSLAVSFSVRIIQLLQNLYFDISSLKGAVLSISKLFCVHTVRQKSI